MHPHKLPSTQVWDPLVRIFHWSLVSFFAIAYFSRESFLTLHSWAGYTVATLVLFRFYWGFVGPRHARFKQFAYPPRQTLDYLKQALAGQESRHVGHNPAGGAMVLALLTSLACAVIFGMGLLGADNQGPFAGTLITTLPYGILEGAHEFFANATLVLIALHIGGVVYTSLKHQENLPKAMFTGRKEQRPNDFQEH